jgi:probable phosphoglycerate mutase
MKKEFYLFRHGETDWNLIGRMQGSADIPLNGSGIAQAESLRTFFDSILTHAPKSESHPGIAMLVSSPLGRARETARIALRIDEASTSAIRSDSRFAETHLGLAEGMTLEELVANFGEGAWASWIGLGVESWSAKFPGGETKGEVRDRALLALNELASEEPAVRVIATHGGLLRRILHHYHPNETMPIDVVNCSVFKFVFENGIWGVSTKPVFTPISKN